MRRWVWTLAAFPRPSERVVDLLPGVRRLVRTLAAFPRASECVVDLLPGVRRLVRMLAVILLLPFAAACGAGGSPGGAGAGAPVAAPFAGCADLARSLPAASASSEGAGGAAGPSLPELSLPCYSGGGVVDLRSLRGPAVVNLWASWCPPCRSELPVLRDFAVRNRGAIRVIGVVSADSRSASTSLAVDLGLTYPHLYDESGALLRALRRSGLPATVFLDRRGQVRTVYSGEAFDRATLDGLAANHLGVLPR